MRMSKITRQYKLNYGIHWMKMDLLLNKILTEYKFKNPSLPEENNQDH